MHLVDQPAWVTDNALLISDIKGFDRHYLKLALTCPSLNRLGKSVRSTAIITGAIQRRPSGFAAPPPKEQGAIVSSVDVSSKQIDDLIATILDAVDRLREYRAALISAAVTGKIDVREEVV